MEAARRLQIKSPDQSRATTPIQLPDTTGQHIMHVIRDSTPDGLTTPRYALTPTPNVTNDNTSILSAEKKNEAPDLINLESAKASPILPQKESSMSEDKSSLESLDKLIDNVPTRFSDSNSIDDEQMLRDSLLTSPTSSEDNIINAIDQNPDLESTGKNVTFSFDEVPDETKHNVTPNIRILKDVNKDKNVTDKSDKNLENRTPIIEITQADDEVFAITSTKEEVYSDISPDSKSARLIEEAEIENRKSPSPSLKEIESLRSASSTPKKSQQEQKEESKSLENVLPEEELNIKLSDRNLSPTQLEEKLATDVSAESKDTEETSALSKLSGEISLETEEKSPLSSSEPNKLDTPSTSRGLLIEDEKQTSDKSPLASRNIHRVGDYGRRQPKTGWL